MPRYDLYIAIFDTIRYIVPSLPATHVVVSLNREDVEWAKYKSNNLRGVWCDHCDWQGTEASVSMLFAWVGWNDGLLSPTFCLFRAFQAASKDRPWDNYLSPFCIVSNGRRVGLYALVTVQLLLWIRSVPASNGQVRRAFVHRLVQRHVIAWPRNVTSIGVPSPLLGLLSYYSIQKYKYVHALGQQTWTVLVDSLPVAKTDVQKLPTTLESWENGRQQHSW